MTESKITFINYPEEDALKIFRRKLSEPYNVHLINFLESLIASMVPYRGKSYVACDSSSTKNIIELLSFRNNDGITSLSNATRSFIKNILSSLLRYGRVFLEIVHMNDGTTRFILIPPYSVFSLFGKYFQYIPKKHRKFNLNKRFIILPKDKIFSIKLPRKLFRSINKFVKFMACRKSTRDIFPDFYFNDINNTNKLSNIFDFKKYTSYYEYCFFEATKYVGYSGNSVYNMKITDYYFLNRYLIYLGVVFNLLETIIHGVNTGLIKFNNNLGSESLIVNIDYKNVLDKLHNRLLKGDLSYSDIRSELVG